MKFFSIVIFLVILKTGWTWKTFSTFCAGIRSFCRDLVWFYLPLQAICSLKYLHILWMNKVFHQCVFACTLKDWEKHFHILCNYMASFQYVFNIFHILCRNAGIRSFCRDWVWFHLPLQAICSLKYLHILWMNKVFHQCVFACTLKDWEKHFHILCNYMASFQYVFTNVIEILLYIEKHY